MNQDGHSSDSSPMALVETEFVKTGRGEFHIILHFCDQERIGCMLDHLQVKPINDSRLLLDPMMVAKTLSGFDRGLTITEFDGPGKRSVLKSALPRRTDSLIQFFEMVIDPREGLVLRRCVCDQTSGERKFVPFSITRDNLDNLLKDLKKML